MSKPKIILLVLLALGMIVAIIATWGSLGSAVCVYCLIIMGAALLYQRFLNHRNEDDFSED